MMIRLYLLALLLIQASFVHARLPVIRASTSSVDIRDGINFYKGRWNISPEVKPDIYVVDKGGAHRTVSFYTDLDTISFQVAPGGSYDFIILLNGKDSAYTRITTVNPSQLAYQKQQAGPVAILFRLGRGDKIYIRGSINGSELLDLMFDTGSDQTVVSESGMKKGVRMQFDETTQSIAFGGGFATQKSHSNKVDIAGLHWEDVPIVRIDDADADGIIGYNLFDGKVVQIDFDKKQLIIYDSLPPVPQGYVKLAMRFRGNLPFIQATVTGSDGKSYEDFFEYDSGGSESMFIDAAIASAQRIYKSLAVIARNRKSLGMDGNAVYSNLVSLPELSIAGYKLPNVPADLEQASATKTLGWSLFGMDVIKRFNVFIDYRHYDIYLRPNSLFTSPYHRSSVLMPVTISIVSVLMMTACVYVYWRVRRKCLILKKHSISPVKRSA